jgi:type IV secretory pathway TraG/TraD family ATPase VirD4
MTARLSHVATRLLYPGRPTAPTAAPKPPGVYLGRGRKGYVFGGPEEHALILGPPRSGKTTRLLVPSVLRHPGPAVVTSTKADVLHATITRRARLGRCWYWDPSGKTFAPEAAEALSWSPVTDCETWDEAVDRAHALVSAARPDTAAHDHHWVERAQALLAPLLHAAAVRGGDLAEVLAWLHGRQLVEPIAVLKDSGSSRAETILSGLAQTDARELSGIFSTADGALAAYRSDAALASTRRPTFDPARFVTSSDTLYLVAPGTAQRLSAPLVVALLEQIREATYRWHPQPPMLFALDEVANIAPLPELPAILAEGGSQGLVVLACLQDLSQARARWGKAADGFLTLFAHKLLLPGVADQATLKAVSTLAGHIDVRIRSESRQPWPRWLTGTTDTTRREPLLPEDQVASAPPGTAILMSGTQLRRVTL